LIGREAPIHGNAPQHDRADGHPLIEEAASQHLIHHGPADQPQRCLIVKA
jgi:hypothetical protein